MLNYDDCFEHSSGNVSCQDGLTLLKGIPTNTVALIVTDPPYEINYNNLEWDKKKLDWRVITSEFSRVLCDTGNLLVFQGWSEVLNTKAYLDAAFMLKNWIIYDRIKGRGAKTNLVSTREDILWYTKCEKGYTYNKIASTIKKKTGGTIGRKNGNAYRALSNVWTDISPIVPWSKERVCHPTQKPLAIMERIITIYSNPNDTVVDPFMGSGTSMVAAKKLNRHWLGCDINMEYVRMTEQRLNNAHRCQ